MTTHDPAADDSYLPQPEDLVFMSGSLQGVIIDLLEARPLLPKNTSAQVAMLNLVLSYANCIEHVNSLGAALYGLPASEHEGGNELTAHTKLRDSYQRIADAQKQLEERCKTRASDPTPWRDTIRPQQPGEIGLHEVLLAAEADNDHFAEYTHSSPHDPHARALKSIRRLIQAEINRDGHNRAVLADITDAITLPDDEWAEALEDAPATGETRRRLNDLEAIRTIAQNPSGFSNLEGTPQ